MSEENVEIVRRVYEAWNRGGPKEDALEFISDQLEYVNPPYAVHTGTRRGREGWLAAAENLDESFETWTHVPGEFVDAGDKVLVITTFRARGRGSSVDLEKYEPHVWTLRDGKVVRFEWFNDRDEAERAAGLSG
jgi:ketosteroid isomerase-like protein